MGRNHILLAGVGYIAFDSLRNGPKAIEQSAQWFLEQPDTPFTQLSHLILSSLAYLMSPYMIPGWALGFVGCLIFLLIMYHRDEYRAKQFSKHNVAYRSALFITGVMLFLTIPQLVYYLFPEVFPESPVEKAVWLIMCMGFGLVPDIDEPKSTVSQVFGRSSAMFSQIAKKLGGGHRYGTHSFLAVAFVFVWTYFSQDDNFIAQFMIDVTGSNWVNIFNRVLAGVLFWIAYGMVLRLALPNHIQYSYALAINAVGFGLAFFIAIGSISMKPMMLAAPLGILLHIAGDWITNTGVALMYPARVRYTVRLFSTNSDVEIFIVRYILIILLSWQIITWLIMPFVGWVNDGGASHFIVNYSSFDSVNQL